MSDPVFVQEQLSNGLRVVLEVMPHVPSAACGFLVRTGARDEAPEVAGVSHFLEHMCFKGTPHRTWEQINIAFDELGAHYNAYTSKDRTFYYGWARAEDFERQLELLADMMQSVLPPEEFETEKNVILEEIAMSDDDLAASAYDFLFENLCARSSFAWPVLGYQQTVRGLLRDQMADYLHRRYSPRNLVLVVAGNLEPARVMAAARRMCGSWPAVEPGLARRPPQLRTGVASRQIERFHQQAVLIAYPSASAVHHLDETAEAVAAILGGVNSRFYWNIVQQGLSPRAGVFREEFADFGLLVLYGLCAPENAEKLTEAMLIETDKLCDGVQAKEIQRVKNLRRTSLAIESEAPYYRLGQLSDDIDYLGRPRSAAERLAAVNAVSEASIQRYLQEFPLSADRLLVSVGPRNWPTPA